MLTRAKLKAAKQTNKQKTPAACQLPHFQHGPNVKRAQHVGAYARRPHRHIERLVVDGVSRRRRFCCARVGRRRVRQQQRRQRRGNCDDQHLGSPISNTRLDASPLSNLSARQHKQAATILERKNERVFFRSASTEASGAHALFAVDDSLVCSFEAILHIYQTNGVVLRPEPVPINLFLRELKFYEVSEQDCNFVSQSRNFCSARLQSSPLTCAILV